MEGTGEGMVAIVQGLQDAGLAVTVTDMKQFDQAVEIQRSLIQSNSSQAEHHVKTSSGVQTPSPSKNFNRTSDENEQESSQHFVQSNTNHSKGGVIPSLRNSSSLRVSPTRTAVMPVSHVQPYRPPFFWDNCSPIASRSSRVSDAFAESLRKYPVLVERTTSDDLIQKLLAFTQSKNATKNCRSKSMRSLSHESPDACADVVACARKSSKNIQTYTRTRPSSPERDVSNIYGKAERRRRISPVKSDRGIFNSTSSRHEPVSTSYDYLKIASPRLSSRSQDCRYLSDVTRYVRDTLRQICDDEPVAGGRVCPRVASRYYQHRKSHHKAEVGTETMAEAKEKERTSCTRRTGSSCSYRSPSPLPIKRQTSESNENAKRRRQECKDQLLCDYCQEPFPCGCSVRVTRQKLPKQIKFDALCKELVSKICPSDESLREECPCPDDIETGIDFIVDHWLKDVPVYADFIIKDEEVRNRLVKDLKANLKKDIGQDNACKLDILECLNSLPMWVPPDVREQKEFKENLADNLLQRLKEAKNVNRYIKVVKKWLDTIPLRQQVNYDKISDELTNKLSEAMFLKDPDDKRNVIKEKAMNELYKLPVDIHPAHKDRFLIDLAENLGDMLLRDEFDDIVFDWALMLPLNTYPPVNRNQFASDLSKKLKSINCTEAGSKINEMTTATVEGLISLPIDCNYSERDKIIPRLAKNLVDKLLRYIKEMPSERHPDSDKCAKIVSDWVRSLPLKPYPVVDRDNIINDLTKKIKNIPNNLKPEDRKLAIINAIIEQLQDLSIDCNPDDIEKILPELAQNLADKLVEAFEKDESANKLPYKDLIHDLDKNEFENAVRDWVDNLPLKSHPYVDRNKLANEQIKLLKEIVANSTPTNRQDAIKGALVNELSKLPIDCPLQEVDKLIPKLAESLAKKLANSEERDELDNIVRNWMKSIPCETLSPAEKNEIVKNLTQKIKDLKDLPPEERKNAIKDIVCRKLSNLPIDCKANIKHDLVSDLADKLANEIVKDEFEKVVKNWVASLPIKPYSNVDNNLVASDLTNRCRNAIKNRDPELIRHAIKDAAIKKLESIPIECPALQKYDTFTKLADNLADNLLKIINNGAVPNLKENVPLTSEPIEDIKDASFKEIMTPANEGNLSVNPSTLADTPVRDKFAEIVQDWANTVPFKSPSMDTNKFINDLTKKLKNMKSNPDTICDENALTDAIYKELKKHQLNANSLEKIGLATNLAKQLAKLPDQSFNENLNPLIEVKSDVTNDDSNTQQSKDGDNGLITEMNSEADELIDISKAELPKKYSINIADWLKDITSPLTKEETQILVRKVLIDLKKLKSEGIDDNQIEKIIKKDIEDNLDSVLKQKGSKIDTKSQMNLATKLFDQLFDTVHRKMSSPSQVITKPSLDEYRKDVSKWLKENPGVIPSQDVDHLANDIAHCLADYTLDKSDSKMNRTEESIIGEIRSKIDPALQNTDLSTGLKRKLAESLYHMLQKRKPRSRSTTLNAQDLPSSKLSSKDSSRTSKVDSQLEKNKVLTDKVNKEVNNWIKDNPELSSITNKEKDVFGDNLTKSIKKICDKGLSKNKVKKKITNLIKTNLDMLLINQGKELDSKTKYKLSDNLFDRLKDSVEFSSVSNSSSFSAQSQAKDIRSKVSDWIRNIPELAATSSLEKKSNEKITDKLANKLIDLKLKDLPDKQTRKILESYIKNSLESGLNDKGKQMSEDNKDKLVKKLIENLVDDFAITSFSTSNSPTKNKIETAMKNQINNWIESIPELQGQTASEIRDNKKMATKLAKQMVKILNKDLDSRTTKSTMKKEIRNNLKTILEKKGASLGDKIQNELTDTLIKRLTEINDQIESTNSTASAVPNKNTTMLQNDVMYLVESIPELTGNGLLEEKEKEEFTQYLSRKLNNLEATKNYRKSDSPKIIHHEIEEWFADIAKLSTVKPANKEETDKMKCTIMKTFKELNSQGPGDDELKRKMNIALKNNLMKKVEPTLKDNSSQSDILDSDTSSSSSRANIFEKNISKKVDKIPQLSSVLSNLDCASQISRFSEKNGLKKIIQNVENRVPDSYRTVSNVLSNIEKPLKRNSIDAEKSSSRKTQTNLDAKRSIYDFIDHVYSSTNIKNVKRDNSIKPFKILGDIKVKGNKLDTGNECTDLKPQNKSREQLVTNISTEQNIGKTIKDVLNKKVESQILHDLDVLEPFQYENEDKNVNRLTETPGSHLRNKYLKEHSVSHLEKALKANIENILKDVPGVVSKSNSSRKNAHKVSQNLTKNIKKASRELKNPLNRSKIKLCPQDSIDAASDKKQVPTKVKTRNRIVNEIVNSVENTLEIEAQAELKSSWVDNSPELSSLKGTETGNRKLSGNLSNPISIIELNDININNPIDTTLENSLNKVLTTKNKYSDPSENENKLVSLEDNRSNDVKHSPSLPKANSSLLNNINKISEKLAENLKLLEVEDLHRPQVNKGIILEIKNELENSFSRSENLLDSQMKKKLADSLMNTIEDTLNQQKLDAELPHILKNDISAWINEIPELVGIGAYEKKQNEYLVRDLSINLAKLQFNNKIDNNILDKMRTIIRSKIIAAIDDKGEHIDATTRAKLTSKLLDKVVKSSKLLDHKYDKIFRELKNQKETLLNHMLELPHTNEVGKPSIDLNSKIETKDKNTITKKYLDKSLQKNENLVTDTDPKGALAENFINNLTDSDKLSSLPLGDHNYLGNIENVVSNWHERITGTSAGFNRQDFNAMVNELSKEIQKLLYSNKSKTDFEKHLKNCIRTHLITIFEKNDKCLNNDSLDVLSNHLVKDVVNDTEFFYQHLLKDKFVNWLEIIFELKTKSASENKKLDRLAEELVQIVNELQSNSTKDINLYFDDIYSQIDSFDYKNFDTKTKKILCDLLLAKVVQECKNIPVLFRGFQKDVFQWLENIPEMMSTTTTEKIINENISKKLSKKLANLQIMRVDDPDVQLQMLEEIKHQLDIALEIRGEYMTPKKKDKFAHKLLRKYSTKAVQEEKNKYLLSLIWDWFHNIAFPLHDSNMENLHMIEQLNNKLQLIQMKTLSTNLKILKMEKEVNNWLKLMINKKDNGFDDDTFQYLTKSLVDSIIPRKKKKTGIEEVKLYNLLSRSNIRANKNYGQNKRYTSAEKSDCNFISKRQSKQVLLKSGFVTKIRPLIIGQVSQEISKSKSLFRKHSCKTEHNCRKGIHFRPQIFNSQPRTSRKSEVYYLEESDDSNRRQSSQKSSISKSGSVKEISKEINPEIQDKIKAILAKNIHLMNTSQLNEVSDKILRVLVDEAGLPQIEAETLVQSVVQKAQARALEMDADEMDLIELILDEIRSFVEEYNLEADKQEKLKDYLTDIVAKRLMMFDDEMDDETKANIIDEIQNSGLNKDEAEELFDRVLGQITRMKSSPAVSRSLNRIKNGSKDKRPSLTLKEQTNFEKKAKKIMKDFFYENLDNPSTKQQAKILNVIEDTVKNLENVLVNPDLDGDEKRQQMKKELYNQLRKLSFLNSDKSVSDLAEELMERLEDIKLKTSTPTKKSIDESTVSFSTSDIDSLSSSASGSRKGSKRDSNQSTSSSRRDSKGNDNEIAYKQKLKTIIKDWLSSLPVDNTTLQDDNFKKTVIEDLAGDIIDRQKYLQLNPNVTTTDEEELENLKYQCYKWLNKFLDDKDLNTAVSKTDKLLEAIKGVKVPKLVDDPLKDKVLSWIGAAPLNIEPIVNDKEKQALVKNLVDKIKKLKNELNGDEKIKAEIYKFLPKIYGDLDETNLRKLGSSLFHSLEDQGPKSNSISIDPLYKAVDKWTESLPIDANTPENKNKLNVAKKDLINNLKKIMQQFDPNLPQNIGILNDEIKKFIQSQVTDPLLKYDEKFLDSKAKELMKMLREIPMQVYKDGTKSKILKKATDTLYDYIKEWCENLPIFGETEKIQLMKQNLASELMNKINEQNMDPDILNDDVLYEDMLSDEVDKIVSDIPRNPELDKYMPALKKDLISKIMNARQMLLDELAGKAYKQQLRDTISTSMYIPENLSPDEIASFELLKDKLADAFINLYFSPDGEDSRLKYKKKISEEVDKFSNNILRRYPCLPLNPNTIKRDLHHALLRVPAPKDDTMKSEVEQLRIRDIINEWMKEIPLRQESQTQKLHRHKVATILAKRLHDIEVEKELNPYLDTDAKMNEAISKFLSKIPLKYGQEAMIPNLVSNLVYRLKNSEHSRKFECRRSKSTETQVDVCSRYPCTLKEVDKAHLLSIKERVKKSCYNDISTNPPLLIDCSSQTDSRSQFWIPHKTCQATKHVPLHNTCQPDLKNHASCMTTPSHCHITPRVIVKEYVWDREESKTPVSCSAAGAPLSPHAAAAAISPVSCGVQSGPSQPAPLPQSYTSTPPHTAQRPSQSSSQHPYLYCPQRNEKEIPCTKRDEFKLLEQTSGEDSPNCNRTYWRPCPNTIENSPPCSIKGQRSQRPRMRTDGFESDWSTCFPKTPQNYEDTCWRHRGKRIPRPFANKRGQPKEKCVCKERVLVSCRGSNSGNQYLDMCQTCGNSCPHPSYMYFRR